MISLQACPSTTMPYISQTKQSIQNINVTSNVVDLFRNYMCQYRYIYIFLECKQKISTENIVDAPFENIYGCLNFILYNILFLTLNYICQTVYYKVQKN